MNSEYGFVSVSHATSEPMKWKCTVHKYEETGSVARELTKHTYVQTSVNNQAIETKATTHSKRNFIAMIFTDIKCAVN